LSLKTLAPEFWQENTFLSSYENRTNQKTNRHNTGFLLEIQVIDKEEIGGSYSTTTNADSSLFPLKKTKVASSFQWMSPRMHCCPPFHHLILPPGTRCKITKKP